MPRRAPTQLLTPAAVLLLAAAIAPPAGAASPADPEGRELIVVGSGGVRVEAAGGAELADAEPGPALAKTQDARPKATASRKSSKRARRASTSSDDEQSDDDDKPSKKTKRKPKRPPIDTRLIRRKIIATSASDEARYDARAALTSVIRVRREVAASSQAGRELTGLLKLTTSLARRGRIHEVRLPIITETLKRNAIYWKMQKPTGSGRRVQFDGSQLVWQYYPGSGIQVQWLGTFGRGNALWSYKGSSTTPKLRKLVDEALELSVRRAGGIAWEYMFPFGGGSAPWVSGMAEATGVQVLSRASQRLEDPDLLDDAKRAQGILKAAPPRGVQLSDTAGSHFLLYSFSPGLKVLNAMNQAVNGLWSYVDAAPDDIDGRLLLLDGLRWLNGNLTRYDTGKWTLYSLGGRAATQHYHELEVGFLKTTCRLLRADAATPGGGPSGAYPSARFCGAADKFAGYRPPGK